MYLEAKVSIREGEFCGVIFNDNSTSAIIRQQFLTNVINKLKWWLFTIISCNEQKSMSADTNSKEEEYKYNSLEILEEY